MTTPIRIQHYSDVLCIWAYISQVRTEELEANFPKQVCFDFHYIHVFGDVHGKLENQWRKRGGIEGYARHVHDVAVQFDHVQPHPDLWLRNTPNSSMPCHLFLCAVRVWQERNPDKNAGPTLLQRAQATVRRAFFEELTDISQRTALLDIAAELELPLAEIESILDSGEAHALLSDDLDLARDNGVRASPTMIFNDGRQRLTGNVGYRVLEANVSELIHRPAVQHSWC